MGLKPITAGIGCVRLSFGFSAALCVIEFANCVGTHFENALLHTVCSYSRVRTAPPWTITYEPLVSVRVNSACFPKVTMRCQSVLLCQLPSATFQDSFVATDSVTTKVPFCEVSFGIRTCEADDSDLIFCVHWVFLFCYPFVPRATEQHAAPLPNDAGVLCWRDRRRQVQKPARGYRQSRTKARAGRVGSSAAGALDNGAQKMENQAR